MKAFLLCGLLLFAYIAPAFAGSVSALVDKTSGTVDDEFILQVTISGSPKDEPSIPDVKGLTIRRFGQSSRTSATIGSITREVEYRYVVTASEPGTYVIPALTVDVDGKKERTAPITLTMRDASAATANNGKDAPEDRPVFVKRTVSKTDVYVGEPVVVNTRIYSAGAVTNIAGGYDAPKDWRRFEKDRENKATTSTETINGKMYAVVEVTEVLLPLKSGKLRIPASLYEVTYRGPGNRRGNEVDDFFGFSFRNQLAQKRVRSQSDEVVVKPLPKLESGKTFRGLIGNFHIVAELSNRDVNVGDSITANITISGDGFIDETFDKIPFKPHESFKVYPDKPESEVNIEADGIKSKKAFKFALVPTQPGDLDLGDVELTVFNPKLGLYADISANLGKVHVNGVAASVPNTASSPKGSEAKTPEVQQADDLVALKSLHDLDGSFFGDATTGFAIKCFFALPLLMFVIGIGRRYTKDYLQRTEGSRHKLLAVKKARQRLKSLDKIASAEEMMDILQELFGARTGDKADALTIDDFIKAIEQRNLSVQLIAQTETLYRKLERSIFAGVTLSDAELQGLKQDLRNLGNELAKEWDT